MRIAGPFYTFDSTEIFIILNPFKSSFKVSTLAPIPEIFPYTIRNVGKGFFADYSLIIVGKALEYRIESSDEIFLFYGTPNLDYLSHFPTKS